MKKIFFEKLPVDKCIIFRQTYKIMTKAEVQRTLPISGRIAEKDYEYLMAHGGEGQVTASEKLRHACSFYRSYHERMERRGECVSEIRRLVQNGMEEIRDAERKEGVYSELVHRLADSLPDLVGVLSAPELNVGKGGSAREELLRLEEELFSRLLLQLEQLLRLGVTSETPTYNRQLTRDRFHTVKELISLTTNKK